uniref:Uncharacterized protein n=1 Tax=Oryza brachyantha TaxID=4533 RepID=J3L3W1_ORYBR
MGVGVGRTQQWMAESYHLGLDWSDGEARPRMDVDLSVAVAVARYFPVLLFASPSSVLRASLSWARSRWEPTGTQYTGCWPKRGSPSPANRMREAEWRGSSVVTLGSRHAVPRRYNAGMGRKRGLTENFWPIKNNVEASCRRPAARSHHTSTVGNWELRIAGGAVDTLSPRSPSTTWEYSPPVSPTEAKYQLQPAERASMGMGMDMDMGMDILAMQLINARDVMEEEEEEEESRAEWMPDLLMTYA